MGRRSSKPFKALWDSAWNERIDMTVIDKDLLTNLEFNNKTNKLTFMIKHYHREPKITRYVTSNYVRTPIYEDYSERTKIIKKFDKIINPLRFVNEDILKLELNKHFILKIIDAIGIIPEWRKKELKLQAISTEIKTLQLQLRDYEKEKTPYNYQKYDFKATNFPEKASNFWWRLFFAFFTLFLSFIKYTTKKQALINKSVNATNKEWNDEHKLKVDNINNQHKLIIDKQNQKLATDIIFFNGELQTKINKLQTTYNNVKTKPITYENIDESGWIDLRHASHFSYEHLKDKKGVYIIWNKTKNKHYVGQSKNIGKRLAQHFKNGEVKNIIFVRDFDNGDQFMYQYHFCDTKDELDRKEKRYIAEYNAFENGYNGTNGNV